MTSLPQGVTEVKAVSATVGSQSSQTGSTVPEQIESIDLTVLRPSDQVQVRMLLQNYQLVFSAHDGDLGCTNLLSHDIPLLEDTQVRQRYRHTVYHLPNMML